MEVKQLHWWGGAFSILCACLFPLIGISYIRRALQVSTGRGAAVIALLAAMSGIAIYFGIREIRVSRCSSIGSPQQGEENKSGQ